MKGTMMAACLFSAAGKLADGQDCEDGITQFIFEPSAEHHSALFESEELSG